LSDSDGKPEQKNYATWSGHSDLARHPNRFGRMRLGKPPQPVAAPESVGVSKVGPIAVLLGALGGLAFWWLARRDTVGGARLAVWIERAAAVPLRRMLAAAGVLAALILLAGFIADGAATAFVVADVAQKRQAAKMVRALASEAAEAHLAGATKSPLA